ncbi:MAG: hypothetical protein KME59_27010 [Trichormus sp. ATA11-4-KO1]|jgi:hypothetical protein|nr:hypothetical protein [Trichormus sp. ATA11-4-KO1]
MTFYASDNSNSIEVNEICFETLVAEETICLPKYGEQTSVQFGVRIVNKTSTLYRFDLPYFLPEILNNYGQFMQISLNKNATREVEESDIPLIIPGESWEF